MNYFKKRYLRIGLAFKQFVTHEDIHSFLCVLNKHPRPKDRDLDRDVLFDIFAYIAADKKWNGYDKRKTVVFLDGSEYEDKKTNLIERLAAGWKKLFVNFSIPDNRCRAKFTIPSSRSPGGQCCEN